MARGGTPEERERLSDAYELRYRGDGGLFPFSRGSVSD